MIIKSIGNLKRSKQIEKINIKRVFFTTFQTFLLGLFSKFINLFVFVELFNHTKLSKELNGSFSRIQVGIKIQLR